MALWFPHLATERILRHRLGPSWRSRRAAEPPLVLSRREKNARRIAALDERAEALGLKRGMGIADARAMHPAIEVAEADPEADLGLLGELADWCGRYTPLVALDAPDGLFLDITGCAHLFGGESAMLDDLRARLSRNGFDARAGLASAPGAAWAAARFPGQSIVPPGQEAPALGPLPLAALRLAPETRAGLEGLGLRSVGALLASPRAPLARRFGRDLLTRLDQALGRLDEPVSPRLPVAPLSVERHLAEPLMMTEGIEALVRLLAESLRTGLERRGEGARRLELLLFRVDGAVGRLVVGASRPLRAPALVERLFREKIKGLEGAIDAGCGFDLVRLSALSTARFDTAQADLDGTVADEAGDLALFADRVRARLGADAVLEARLVESHIPERAVRMRPFAGALAGKPAAPQRSAERPVRLFRRPEPVEVTAEVPEGPPLLFRWRRAFHRVARSEGPERIAPEWWREPSDDETRDYFRVEDEAGRRYWLYRQGLYGADRALPRWFMQGIFA